jgi:hypothetical protein
MLPRRYDHYQEYGKELRGNCARTKSDGKKTSRIGSPERKHTRKEEGKRSRKSQKENLEGLTQKSTPHALKGRKKSSINKTDEYEAVTLERETVRLNWPREDRARTLIKVLKAWDFPPNQD